MSEVKHVEAVIKKVSPAFPHGQNAIGHYIVEDRVVIMTDRVGKPAVDLTGKKYSQALAPTDNDADAAVIAMRLTRKLRAALLGTPSSVAGFTGKIPYKKSRVA